MRRRNVLVTAAVAAVLLAAAGRAAAPEVTRSVVLENDRVRAQTIDYPPGAVAPDHEHAVPRVVVVLQGGTLEFRPAGGAPRRLEVKAGEVAWRPPERHSIANVGETAVRVVEVDLLDGRQP